MRHFLLITFILLSAHTMQAQTSLDSLQVLEDVLISDYKLNKYFNGKMVREIDDSLIYRNEPLLTSLLKFNTPFFFRENGYGMVSSASARGTNASHTAVIWNGININSQLNGQTDFNTISSYPYGMVSFMPGGGSVVYGSGAIGGSVHLNEKLNFDGRTNSMILLGYGSFDTKQATYRGNYSTKKTSIVIGASGVDSQNDYPYLETDAVNENGDFYNYSFNTSVGRWVGDNALLKFHSNLYAGRRGFSGTLNMPSMSKYEDLNSRNLVELKKFSGKVTHTYRLAFLQERYKYFENRFTNNYDFGRSNSAIAKYDLDYRLSEYINLNLTADYTNITAEGSGIEKGERNNAGLAALWKHDLGKLGYQISLRQEYNDQFNSPFLFSGGINYELNKTNDLYLNFSRNYRVPTFNDLFWESGGNRDLEPETSLQAEIGHTFELENFKSRINLYMIHFEEMIRWIPQISGLWQPVNTNEVRNLGLEVYLDYFTEIGTIPVNFSGSYAYTNAEDLSIGKQLIYTPAHKLTFSSALEISKFEIYVQSLYSGSIFTAADNQYEIPGYFLADAGISYLLNEHFRLGFQVQNLLNVKYESMPSRIMPGRSYKTSITFNF